MILKKIIDACNRTKIKPTPYLIFVSIGEQKLYLFYNNCLIKTFDVSTSRATPSCVKDSLGTPTGLHIIDGKIGDNEPIESVFVARKSVGLLQNQSQQMKEKNLITTRILRLRGLEYGKNLGGNVDTYDRFVYIHGTNQEDKIGTPNSHGCVLLKNKNVLELFDVVSDKSLVLISME